VIGAFNGWATAFLVVHLARMGRKQEVLELVDQHRAGFAVPRRPHTIGDIQMTLAFLEAAWIAGLDDLCASLYPVVEETLSRGVLYRVFDFRSSHLLGALACDSAGDVEGAERHVAAGLQDARSAPLPVQEAEICLFRARMLHRRGDGNNEVPGLLDRAQELLGGMGMQNYLALMKRTLSL
jgi:hypothetical protein